MEKREPLGAAIMENNMKFPQKTKNRASLVVQWLRIHLPMQGTQVQSLAQEDPTCHGATKPCATTTEPAL